MTRQAISVLRGIIFGLFCAQSLAWVSVSPRAMVVHRSSILVLRAGDDDDNDDNEEAILRPETTNPCWQSFLDDDCNMSTMYASNFVAGKWIKSMPCAEGIEVRKALPVLIAL